MILLTQVSDHVTFKDDRFPERRVLRDLAAAAYLWCLLHVEGANGWIQRRQSGRHMDPLIFEQQHTGAMRRKFAVSGRGRYVPWVVARRADDGRRLSAAILSARTRNAEVYFIRHAQASSRCSGSAMDVLRTLVAYSPGVQSDLSKSKCGFGWAGGGRPRF